MSLDPTPTGTALPLIENRPYMFRVIVLFVSIVSMLCTLMVPFFINSTFF